MSYYRRPSGLIYLIGAILLLLALAAFVNGAEPDQVARWKAARVDPHWSIALDIDAALYLKNQARYQKITDMRSNGVPPAIIFGLHQRESSGNFRCHPHEGSPLTGRTRDVPKGRPKPPAMPPFTFEESAADAYYSADRLDLVNWKSAQIALQGIESFNGLGYQKYHPETPSPYLWNGTLINGKPTRGKYVKDGKFDRTATDKQLGVCAILLHLQKRGIAIPWEKPTPAEKAAFMESKFTIRSIREGVPPETYVPLPESWFSSY